MPFKEQTDFLSLLSISVDVLKPCKSLLKVHVLLHVSLVGGSVLEKYPWTFLRHAALMQAPFLSTLRLRSHVISDI